MVFQNTRGCCSFVKVLACDLIYQQRKPVSEVLVVGRAANKQIYYVLILKKYARSDIPMKGFKKLTTVKQV